MDDDGSKSLSEPEFIKAVKDFRVGIAEDSVPTLFNAFDTNRDGTINYDEFLYAVRGELNDFRKGLVEKAFRKVDKDGSGFLDINDIKGVYNGSKHPDVISGRKTDDQILVEFLETFEAHHNLKTGREHDSSVDIEEWTEYYTNINASIDNDEYFALMMNNSWNLKGDASTYKKYGKGWSGEEAKPKPVPRQPPEPVQRSGQMSQDNPLVNTHQYFKPSTTASKGNLATAMHAAPHMEPEEQKSKNMALVKDIREKAPPRNNFSGGYVPESGPPKGQASGGVSVPNTKPPPKFQTMLVERFRNKLRTRGGRGFVGLRRQFKIMDDNNSGSLDQYEFKKAIKDFQVDVPDQDIDHLFKAFDHNGNGDIEFDEFIRIVVGPMNQFRTQLVVKAFNFIDANGDGTLDIDDIKGKYDASKHPDVRSGKLSEDEVLTEFLETFETHHNVMHGGQSDGKVTVEEFVEYYTNISANVDNDAYFDLMMSNAWQMDSRNNPANTPFAGSSRKVTAVSARDAWRADHHKNLFGTAKNTPFGKDRVAEWGSSAHTGHGDVAGGDTLPTAGGATFGKPGDHKKQFMTASQRESGATYSGIQHSDDDLVKMFRGRLNARGARGILGLQRVFKIMDDNNNGSLDIQEFWKALCDFRVSVSADECRRLFELFDVNGDDTVDYNELLRTVAGAMNAFRKGMVKKAFDKLDDNKNGILEIDDIKRFYNAKCHPDVKSKKKSEEEVLSEFLDTFELHHSLKHPEQRDRKVNFNEFMEYYNNISCSIDNDQYFELMMKNAWNLDNVSYKKAWGGEA